MEDPPNPEKEMSTISIRPATGDDAPQVLALIRALAEYEHLENTVCMREEVLREWIESGSVHALLVSDDGQLAGFALYYFTYATFRAQRGVFLEDLFVKPEFRKRGLGLALFKALAEEAYRHACHRMDWLVLNWNTKSIAFYRRMGARPIEAWSLYRLDETALHDLRQ